MDSVNYDSSILGRAGSRSVLACPARPAGWVAGGLCGFVTTVQPCSVHKPRFQYTFNPSSAPGSASLVPAIIVSTGLCTRARVCFGVLGVSVDALEPDVTFPVQPLQAPCMYGGRRPPHRREVCRMHTHRSLTLDLLSTFFNVLSPFIN